MRTLFLCLVSMFICFTHALSQQSTDDVCVTGDNLPSFKVQHSKQTIASSDLQGKVSTIVFFATWCPPCQKELAEIERTLWPQYKHNDQFTLLVIGRQHTEEELEKYNERKGFTFPLYPDKDKSIYELFAKKYIPRTYVIGRNGKIIYQSSGFNEADFKNMMQVIQKEINR